MRDRAPFHDQSYDVNDRSSIAEIPEDVLLRSGSTEVVIEELLSRRMPEEQRRMFSKEGQAAARGRVQELERLTAELEQATDA